MTTKLNQTFIYIYDYLIIVSHQLWTNSRWINWEKLFPLFLQNVMRMQMAEARSTFIVSSVQTKAVVWWLYCA